MNKRSVCSRMSVCLHSLGRRLSFRWMCVCVVAMVLWCCGALHANVESLATLAQKLTPSKHTSRTPFRTLTARIADIRHCATCSRERGIRRTGEGCRLAVVEDRVDGEKVLTFAEWDYLLSWKAPYVMCYTTTLEAVRSGRLQNHQAQPLAACRTQTYKHTQTHTNTARRLERESWILQTLARLRCSCRRKRAQYAYVYYTSTILSTCAFSNGRREGMSYRKG